MSGSGQRRTGYAAEPRIPSSLTGAACSRRWALPEGGAAAAAAAAAAASPLPLSRCSGDAGPGCGGFGGCSSRQQLEPPCCPCVLLQVASEPQEGRGEAAACVQLDLRSTAAASQSWRALQPHTQLAATQPNARSQRVPGPMRLPGRRGGKNQAQLDSIGTPAGPQSPPRSSARPLPLAPSGTRNQRWLGRGQAGWAEPIG